MILIRGIYGEDYAKTIKNGKISCRDLLSTAIETHNTGYNYSDYYEKYLVQANNQIHRVDDKRIPMFVKRNKLILDKYIPNMYLTYFHVLNEDSEAWVNQNFDDDVHFIYYIPRLDGVTGELIGDTPYFGKKMIYVDELSNDPDNQNWYIHMGLMSYIDPESPETTGQSAALLKRYNALMYPLFQRVKDEKFTSVENEFRIIYISFPRFFDGNWVHEPPKKYRFHVNGIPYSGEYAGNDIILTSDSAILQNRKTTLWNETYNNSEIKIDSEFVEIDIRNNASGYGYIGGKEKCVEFINKMKKTKYYDSNDTLKQIIYRELSPNDNWDCIIRPRNINIKYEK